MTEQTPLTADEEYLCPNCCTPWKCNGPHIPEGTEPLTKESEAMLWSWDKSDDPVTVEWLRSRLALTEATAKRQAWLGLVDALHQQVMTEQAPLTVASEALLAGFRSDLRLNDEDTEYLRERLRAIEAEAAARWDGTRDWKYAALLFRANLYQDFDGEGVRMMCRNCEVVDAHDPDCEVLEAERLVGLAPAEPKE